MCDQNHLIWLLLWLRWPCLLFSEMPWLLQRVAQTELGKIQTLLHSLNNHTVAHGLEFNPRDSASAKCPPVLKEVVGILTFESTASMRIPHYSSLKWLHKLIWIVLAPVLFLLQVQNTAKEWLPSSIFHYLQWTKLSFSKRQASENLMTLHISPIFCLASTSLQYDIHHPHWTLFSFFHILMVKSPKRHRTAHLGRKAMGYWAYWAVPEETLP